MSLLSIPVLGCIILFFRDHQLAQSLPGAAKSLLACWFSSSLARNPTRALLVSASFFSSFNSVQVCVWKASYYIPCLVWNDPSHIQFVYLRQGSPTFLARQTGGGGGGRMGRRDGLHVYTCVTFTNAVLHTHHFPWFWLRTSCIPALGHQPGVRDPWI